MPLSGLKKIHAAPLRNHLSEKKVYATTGSRIKLRVFGGFGLRKGDERARNFAKKGYSKGVPMGGDLSEAPRKKAPRFIVQVAKDPLGPNLDRVQIIKGWTDDQGQAHERVYDVRLVRREKNWFRWKIVTHKKTR